MLFQVFNLQQDGTQSTINSFASAPAGSRPISREICEHVAYQGSYSFMELREDVLYFCAKCGSLVRLQDGCLRGVEDVVMLAEDVQERAVIEAASLAREEFGRNLRIDDYMEVIESYLRVCRQKKIKPLPQLQVRNLWFGLVNRANMPSLQKQPVSAEGR